MEKIQEISSSNSVQVSKTNLAENGNVYVDLPSKENLEKLTPLLNGNTFVQSEVVDIKSKLPTISILNLKGN